MPAINAGCLTTSEIREKVSLSSLISIIWPAESHRESSKGELLEDAFVSSWMQLEGVCRKHLGDARNEDSSFEADLPSSSVRATITSLSLPWNSSKKGRTLNSYTQALRSWPITTPSSRRARTSLTLHCPSGWPWSAEGRYSTLKPCTYGDCCSTWQRQRAEGCGVNVRSNDRDENRQSGIKSGSELHRPSLHATTSCIWRLEDNRVWVCACARVWTSCWYIGINSVHSLGLQSDAH